MRTLNEQIQRVKDALVTCYNAIKRKGGTIPEAGERTLLNMPAAVLSIPQTHGVMGDLVATENNKEYLPTDYGVDGFSKVTTDVYMDTAKLTSSNNGTIPNKFSKLDASGWDVSSTEVLGHMFNGCIALSDLGNLSRWDMSNKTNIASMFNGCSNLVNVGDISNWDTRNVRNMSYLFSGCGKVKISNLNWIVDNVTTLFRTFYYCETITISNLSDWNVGNVTNMEGLFTRCRSITNLNLRGWDMRKVTSMAEMFTNCTNVTIIDFTDSQTSNLLTTLSQTFGWCSAVEEIRGISSWDTSKVTNITWTFRDCTKLKSLDLSGWDLSSTTSITNTFGNTPSLKSIRVGSGWNKGVDISTTGLLRDGLVQFFNDLPTISEPQTITIGTAKQALLTEEDIAIVTNKNWTIA